MTRKNLFFIVIAFIVGVSVWLFYVNRSLTTSQEVLLQQVQEQRRPVVKSVSVGSPAAKGQSILKKQLQEELQNHQKKLEEERAKLLAQKFNLDELKDRQSEVLNATNNSANSYGVQISEYTQNVQDAISELQGYEMLEQEINQRAADQLREQSSAAQVLRDQIDLRIAQQSDLIKQTQEQIQFQKDNYSTLENREARIQDLILQLENQMRDLQQMRGQRLQLSAQVLANTEAFNLEKSQALGELQENRRSIQQEIMDLRNEINRLFNLQYQSRANRMSILSEIQQRQKDFEKQSDYVKGLESSQGEIERQLKLME